MHLPLLFFVPNRKQPVNILATFQCSVLPSRNDAKPSWMPLKVLSSARCAVWRLQQMADVDSACATLTPRRICRFLPDPLRLPPCPPLLRLPWPALCFTLSCSHQPHRWSLHSRSLLSFVSRAISSVTSAPAPFVFISIFHFSVSSFSQLPP